MTGPDADPPPRELVEVARVGRSHGLEGAVRVHPRDDASLEALRAAERVWVEPLGELSVVDLRPHGAHWLLRMDRVRRVEVAKSLVHAGVFVDVRDLPEEVAADLGRDATGLPVWVDGERYGEVVAVEGTPSQPILRVRGPHGQRLVPAAAAYVEVDDDAVRVTRPPPGLLDDA